MNKKDLISQLRKLGIEAHYRQKKAELERMLELARTATKKVRPNRVYKPQYREDKLLQKRLIRISDTSFSWSFLGGILFIFLAFATVLYSASDTFRKNFSYLAEQSGVTPVQETKTEGDITALNEGLTTTGTGPRIYEKNGQSFVVYDFPLIGVSLIEDAACNRPACDTAPLLSIVKDTITPLIKLQKLDYKTQLAQNLIAEYDIKSLPVLIFDSHLQLTDNFDTTSNFFTQTKDKFVMQVDPYKVLSEIPLAEAHFKGASPLESDLKIVEFSSFSCSHCKDSVALIDSALEKYPNDVTVYFYHFNREGIDTVAALASECAAEQGKFWEMHDLLFEQQDRWVGELTDDAKRVMTTFANGLGLNRTEFNACMDEERYLNIISQQTLKAQEIGVKSLPTFLLNQDMIPGVYPQDQFDEFVRSYLDFDELDGSTESVTTENETTSA